jgi:branched-chain amino acid transport system substrate-binding protein
MKTGYSTYQPLRVTTCLAALLLTCLVAVPLLGACGGEEEKTPTPSGTPTAEATESPTAAATATPTTTGEVPGITDTEIILGVDAPIAGGMGAVYKTIPEATKAYFDYINDTQGGVCGRKIVYKMEDNQLDAAAGMEAARKLVEGEKVFAIVGSLGDAPHNANWDYYNEQGVPDLLVSAGTSKFGSDPEGHPWTFQMIPSYRVEVSFFCRYITESMPGAKVAILYENSVLGADAVTGLEENLDPAKNEIVSEQSYETTDVSVRSQVAAMKNANAEAVVLYSTPGFTSQAIAEADRLGWHPQWFISYINADPMLFQFVSPATLLDGAITSHIYKMVDWDDPAVNEFKQIQHDYNGPSPTQFTLYAHSLGELAVEILSRSCDNLTREGVIEATASIHGWHSELLTDGIDVCFGLDDRVALGNGRLLKIVFQDGKPSWEYFGPVYTYPGQECP